MLAWLLTSPPQHTHTLCLLWRWIQWVRVEAHEAWIRKRELKVKSGHSRKGSEYGRDRVGGLALYSSCNSSVPNKPLNEHVCKLKLSLYNSSFVTGANVIDTRGEKTNLFIVHFTISKMLSWRLYPLVLTKMLGGRSY